MVTVQEKDRLVMVREQGDGIERVADEDLGYPETPSKAAHTRKGRLENQRGGGPVCGQDGCGGPAKGPSLRHDARGVDVRLGLCPIEGGQCGEGDAGLRRRAAGTSIARILDQQDRDTCSTWLDELLGKGIDELTVPMEEDDERRWTSR
jgi:hypothetical protein